MALFEVYADPLQVLRPFPEDPKSLVEAHWHEIILAALMYQLVFKLSQWLSPKVFPQLYPKLSPGDKANFDIHNVSMFQCIVNLSLIVPLFGDPVLSTDRVTAHTPYATMVGAVACGYFLWDVYVCIAYYDIFGLGFLLHGIVSGLVFSQCLRPYMQYWIPGFLIFEGSTPFVNFNWYASKVSGAKFSERFVVINGLLLIISFFLIRIVWGWYAICCVVYDISTHFWVAPLWVPVLLVGSNLLLDGLNVIWFNKMVRIALKKIKGAKSSAKKAD